MLIRCWFLSGRSCGPVSFLPTSMWMSHATRPLFSGYLHILNTKFPSTGVMVVTCLTRSAMTHVHEDVSGSSRPPAKKMKLEPTSATTAEICLPYIESSSLVTRGRFTLVVRPFSLLTSTARQLKIPNPRTQPNEGDKLKAKGRQKQKSTIPRCFQNVSIALGKSVPTS